MKVLSSRGRGIFRQIKERNRRNIRIFRGFRDAELAEKTRRRPEGLSPRAASVPTAVDHPLAQGGRRTTGPQGGETKVAPRAAQRPWLACAPRGSEVPRGAKKKVVGFRRNGWSDSSEYPGVIDGVRMECLASVAELAEHGCLQYEWKCCRMLA